MSLSPLVARRIVSAPLIALALGHGVGAQTIVRNTKQVGFLPLPGPDITKGLWSYEANGRQYCLQTRGQAGLEVIDMTDTSHPVSVGNVPGNYRKVAVWGQYAYATDDVTAVIDLGEPTAPRIVGMVPTGSHTLRIDDSNGRLYMSRNGILDLYDLVASPTAPMLIGSWAGGAHDCRPAGKVAYVNVFQNPPTQILDVSDPSKIERIGSIPVGNHSSALYRAPGERLILIVCDEAAGGFVRIFDVTDPTQVEKLAYYQASPYSSAHNVEVRGVYAYIAYYQDQLRILDLTEPAEPVEVGIWDNNPANRGALFSDAWEVIPHHDALYMNQMDDTQEGPKGVHAIDFFPAFGRASPGAGEVEPEIWWSFGPPSPGNERFALRLTNALPHANYWLLIGGSNRTWGERSLPTSLGFLGAPEATLQVSPDRWLRGVTDAQGSATLPLPVPSSYPFTKYFVQFLVADPGAPGRLAATKGGEIVIW